MSPVGEHCSIVNIGQQIGGPRVRESAGGEPASTPPKKKPVGCGEEPRAMARVLICNENMGFGGGEVHTLALARSLPRLHWEARLLCRRGSWLDQAAEPDLTRHHATFANELDVLTVARAVAALRGVQLAHAHAGRDHLLVGVASRLRGIPLVRTLHSFLEPSLSGLARYVLRHHTRRIICVSEAMRRHALSWGVSAERLEVITNGIDVERFQPQPRGEARRRLGLPLDATIVGAISGLWHLKGPDVFLRAMAGVPYVHVLVAGNGPMRDDLGVLARQLGLGERITFTGQLDDPRLGYAAADLIVLASRRDAFPLVALEAQACGRPVVAFEVDGIPETLADDTGVLVPAGDVARLARAIQALTSDGERMKRMGRAGVERVRARFSQDLMVRRVVALYDAVLTEVALREGPGPRH